MAATLIVEDGTGKADANSYATVAEADAYHETRLFVTAWTGASTPDKTAALIWATRVIDEQTTWDGARVDQRQALQWPRYGVPSRDRNIPFDSDIVPVFLKDATAEMARLLIAGDRTADNDTEGFKRLKVGPVEIEPNASDRPTILPRSVASILGPYAMRMGESSAFMKVVRV